MTATWWFRSVLALVLLTGIILRASHVYDQHPLTPNERTYLSDAAQIHDEGIAVTPALFTEYRYDPALWANAPPLRVGYIFLLAAVMKIMGTTTLSAGMALSFVASVFSLLLVAWLGLRFFNPWVSLIASALCATAFTEIWLVRGTPEDGVVGLCALIEIWITCEMMRAPRRLWLHVPFHLVGIWAILLKQSGVFIYGFCALALVAFLLTHEKAVRQAIALIAGLLAGLVFVAGLYVLLAGGVHEAWTVCWLSVVSNDENWAYNSECCFGPWTQIPFVLFLLSPLTFVLWSVGLVVLALPGKWRSGLSSLQRNYGVVCAVMATGFVMLFTFYSSMEILRFITPGQGAACLIAGIGLCSLLSFAKRQMMRIEFGLIIALVTFGMLGSAARDYMVFNRVVMQGGIPELGSAVILSVLGR